MLFGSQNATSSIRLYSTRGKAPSEPRNDSTEEYHPSSHSVPDLTTGFGFQSLRGLLEQSDRPRYSRPPEIEVDSSGEDTSLPEQNAPSSTNQIAKTLQPSEARSINASPQFTNDIEAQTVETTSPNTTTSSKDVKGNDNTDAGQNSPQKPRNARLRFYFDRKDSWDSVEEDGLNKALYEKAASREKDKLTIARELNISPFAEGTILPKGLPYIPLDRRSRSTADPWGWNSDRRQKVNPANNSESSPTVAESETAMSGRNQMQNVERPKALATGDRLTHVKSTGEAHMVDVGSKRPSRRVAIASSHVRFSNPEPFRLILENNNKKGDVLGTARIAGVTAAKRTSELIPLCHPLAISKVDVDVKPVSPGAAGHLWTENENGLVAIQAQVECRGPTGVEMEALTAVSIAALTVYDMCKAVDRHMSIENSRVVYKSGGKSGTHLNPIWRDSVDESFFVERNLERLEGVHTEDDHRKSISDQ